MTVSTQSKQIGGGSGKLRVERTDQVVRITDPGVLGKGWKAD